MNVMGRVRAFLDFVAYEGDSLKHEFHKLHILLKYGVYNSSGEIEAN